MSSEVVHGLKSLRNTASSSITSARSKAGLNVYTVRQNGSEVVQKHIKHVSCQAYESLG